MVHCTNRQNHSKPLVYQSSQVYQDCTNSVPIIKNSQKTVKTAKMTIGVPIVTCLHRVRRIHKVRVRVRRIHKAVCAWSYCHLANGNKTCPSLLVCHTSVDSGDLNQAPPKQSAVCSTVHLHNASATRELSVMACAFGMSATQSILG